MIEPRLQLARAASTYRYEREEHSYEGWRGAIILSGGVGPHATGLWHTVELVARDGVKYVSVRPGWYQVEMARMSNGRRALRIRSEGHSIDTYASRATFLALDRGHVYLHGIGALVLRPDHLKGCIGVGMSAEGSGVAAPYRAMAEIYSALGGFEVGRLFPLEVAA